LLGELDLKQPFYVVQHFGRGYTKHKPYAAVEGLNGSNLAKNLLSESLLVGLHQGNKGCGKYHQRGEPPCFRIKCTI
jgi:hypothetical protein